MDAFDEEQQAFNGSPLDDEKLLSGQFWGELRVFLAVAKTKSFNRAAEITNTSQPRVSRQVKRLQDVVGSQLFIATARGVKLTQKGEALARALCRLDHTLYSITSDLMAETSEAEGTVRISLTDGLNTLFAAPALDQFSARYPKIQMHLKSPINILNLRENQTDIMIGFSPVESSDIRFRKLGQLHFIPVAAKDYIRKYGLPTRNNLEEHLFLRLRHAGQGGAGHRATWQLHADGAVLRAVGTGPENFGPALPDRAHRPSERPPGSSSLRLAERSLRRQQSVVQRRVQAEQSAERARRRFQEDVQSCREW
jgi:DNA-binding transcriptional LysR family regulator